MSLSLEAVSGRPYHMDGSTNEMVDIRRLNQTGAKYNNFAQW